jgi:ribonuclease J
MFNLTIHRGTDEIGGSCVELWNENTRIVLDFGMPLFDQEGNEFNFKPFEKMTVDELISNSILPDIPGLYKKETKKTDALLISHAHLDHYGLINYVGKHVPVYLGEATHEIIKISEMFNPRNISLPNVTFFKYDVKFQIGDFTITPFSSDHSAFDAYLFLIECDGKRILYTGDFRFHGRKSKVMQRFIAHPPPSIDYLIMEGTQLASDATISKTEEEIELEFLTKFKEDKLNLVYPSGQNIDRLVSIFKACRNAGKTLVFDVYVAMLLSALSRYAQLPYPSKSFENIKVLYTKFSSSKLKGLDKIKFLYKFKNFKISKEDINANPSNYDMIVISSMIVDFDKMPDIQDGNFIYSM